MCEWCAGLQMCEWCAGVQMCEWWAGFCVALDTIQLRNHPSDSHPLLLCAKKTWYARVCTGSLAQALTESTSLDIHPTTGVSHHACSCVQITYGMLVCVRRLPHCSGLNYFSQSQLHFS